MKHLLVIFIILISSIISYSQYVKVGVQEGSELGVKLKDSVRRKDKVLFEGRIYKDKDTVYYTLFAADCKSYQSIILVTHGLYNKEEYLIVPVEIEVLTAFPNSSMYRAIELVCSNTTVKLKP